ncbi:hypothetical protein HKCCE3408_15355 [Rhodobacterales bacterium HKCCE3408]|nr:hypothetical protein [Rhodobacterales bacterium HKCCE3408]
MIRIATTLAAILGASAAAAHEAGGLAHAHPHGAMTLVAIAALGALWAGLAIHRMVRERIRRDD